MPFTHRVTSGWLRDLASEPTPTDKWPCIRWDEKLLEDQIRFLDVQAELKVTCNLAWGYFIDRAWPVPLENVVDDARRRMLKAFVDAAHQRDIKILSGVGIYSWGFDDVIQKIPGVSRGHRNAMCPFQPDAWDWQRRVLDFQMDPKWNLDGLSLQSADQGRCECVDCAKRSPAEHHADILIRSAEYVRSQRPDWIIGQAGWGLPIDMGDGFEHVVRTSKAFDYMVGVQERTAFAGKRPQVVDDLHCAFGSVGGVFLEPPQHWDRFRWCLPTGLGSARALRKLYEDGGRACEYFYRTFLNPVEEVSWRTGTRILSNPEATPEDSLEAAIEAVYATVGGITRSLADWFARAKAAYFSRVDFKEGQGPISLEPLVWKENPSACGPPVYLSGPMTPERRADYGQELRSLQAELDDIQIPNQEAVNGTKRSIAGTLSDIASLQDVPHHKIKILLS